MGFKVSHPPISSLSPNKSACLFGNSGLGPPSSTFLPGLRGCGGGGGSRLLFSRPEVALLVGGEKSLYSPGTGIGLSFDLEANEVVDSVGETEVEARCTGFLGGGGAFLYEERVVSVDARRVSCGGGRTAFVDAVGVGVEELLADSCGGGSIDFIGRAGAEELFVGFPSLLCELGRDEGSKGGGSFRDTVPFLVVGVCEEFDCELLREDMPGLGTVTQSGSSDIDHGLLGLFGFGTASFKLLGGWTVLLASFPPPSHHFS